MTIMWLVHMPAISKQNKFLMFKLFIPGDKWLIWKHRWICNSTAKDKEQSLQIVTSYIQLCKLYLSITDTILF